MTHFLKFLEVCRTEGISFTAHGPGSLALTRPPSDKEWAAFAECQPFVFARSQDQMSETINIDTDKLVLAAPFKVFSFEMLNDYKLELRPLAADSRKVYCRCLVTIEKAPGQFAFFILAEAIYTDEIKAIADEVFEQAHSVKYFRAVMVNDEIGKGIISSYMRLLNKGQSGVESVRTSVKIGSGKSKHTHRIRRLVHVWPKKMVREYLQGSPSKQIDWSHRWLRRGHWVKLPGRLGKDREGNYCVKDWTWRSEHEVGPEHLPLINKVRLVHE